MTRCLVLGALTGLFLLSSAVSAEEREPTVRLDSVSAIDQAMRAGQIAPEEATVLKFYAVTGSEHLPQTYSSTVPSRCGLEVSLALDAARSEEGHGWSASLSRDIDRFLSRPSGLAAHYDTEHFRIHYATSGGRAPAGWPNESYVQAVGEACEASWRAYHETQDWRVPPADGVGGDDRIDCYIDNLSGVYGYAQPEAYPADDFGSNRTAFFVIDNDYEGFGRDPLDLMRVTVAHEYHHVVQMGYTTANGWWMEQLSTSMEDQVFDHVDDNHQYLSAFTSAPYRRLHYMNGGHEYGGFLWPTWMTENFGSDLAREVEECAAGDGIFECFEQAFSDRDSSWDAEFANFWRWMFYTSTHDDGNHWDEHYTRSVSPDRTIRNYPRSDVRPQASKMPEAVSTSVMRFNREVGSSHNQLVIHYRGHGCTEAVFLFQVFPDGMIREYPLPLDASGDGFIEVSDFDESEYVYMYSVFPRSCGGGVFDYAFDVETIFASSDAPNPGGLSAAALEPSYPNPFDSSTMVRFALESPSEVRLEIFDSSGRLVRTLASGPHGAGEFSIDWNGRDDGGRDVSPGVYFNRLTTERGTVTRKLTRVQ